jgi:hypothetical protein
MNKLRSIVASAQRALVRLPHLVLCVRRVPGAPGRVTLRRRRRRPAGERELAAPFRAGTTKQRQEP